MTNDNPFYSLKNSKGFIPFFVLGDPSFEESLALIKAAIDAGADTLELGFPFSDPIADGPIIQRANERAVKHMNFKRVLELISAIRAYSNIPMNLLTYANPLYRHGYEKALIELKEAGLDGLLVADVPFDEDEMEKFPLHPPLIKGGIHSVRSMIRESFLIAPNTPLERAQKIHQNTTAFTYLVNQLGTTGLRDGVSAEIMVLLGHLTHVAPETPKVIGFGIHTPAQAKQLFSAGADAIIVGSKIVQFIETESNQADRLSAIQHYIKAFKRDIHS
jgi:tryptophan synthase alpha chain